MRYVLVLASALLFACAGSASVGTSGTRCDVVDSAQRSGCRDFSSKSAALLAAAQDQLKALEPERAKAILDRFGAGPHRRADRLKYAELMGIALARLGDDEGSVAAFAAALKIDRNFSIPYNMPKNVTFLFERARTRNSAPAPEIQLSWAPGLEVDEPVALSLRKLGAEARELVRARVLVRRAGERETLYFESTLADGETKLVVPPLAPARRKDTVALVHAIAYDADGNESVYWGSADSPREIHLSYVPPPPLWRRTRFLIPAILVGAATIGVASWLLFRGDPTDREADTIVRGLSF